MREMIERYLQAKQDESLANERRVAIEEQIIEVLGGIEAEGSMTKNIEGYKITLTQKMSRKLDENALLFVRQEVPEDMIPVEEVTSLKINDKGCRWLKENEPGVWRLVSKCITEKPMKIGVKIEESKI